MWKQILDMAKRLFVLAEDTKRNHDEIKELRDEMRRLTAATERLAYEIIVLAKEKPASVKN